MLVGLLLILSVLLTACGSGSALTAASWPGLSTDETNAYLAYGPNVYAINLTTNRESWHYPQEPSRASSFFASPALSEEGLVIVGGYDSMVYALDPSLGGDVRLAWTFEGASDNIIGAPVVAGDIVLVPSADSNLYALDLSTGDPAWTQPFSTDEALWSAPLVEGDVIYLASLDHRVYAIDLATGKELWSTEPLNGAIADTPTLVGDLILVGTFNSQLVGVDSARRGEIAWTFETSGWVWGNPAVDDDLAGRHALRRSAATRPVPHSSGWTAILPARHAGRSVQSGASSRVRARRDRRAGWRSTTGWQSRKARTFIQ